MRILYPLLLLLVAAVVLAAGCTQGTGPAPVVTPAPSGTPDLHDLALSPAEVPACFSLTGQHEKKPGEVGQLAKDLGWLAGYEVTYSCPEEGRNATVILHSLAVYPAVNMPGLVSLVDRGDRREGFAYENLSFVEQGTAMQGFYGKPPGLQASGASPGSSAVGSGRTVSETDTLSGSDEAELVFSRGTVFEVLKMTGPGTNTTLLRDMAGRVSAKIP
jgi:hypothetical protein